MKLKTKTCRRIKIQKLQYNRFVLMVEVWILREAGSRTAARLCCAVFCSSNAVEHTKETHLSPSLLNAANVSTAAPASSSSMLDVEGLLGLPPSLLQITEDQLPSTSFTPDPNTPFVSFSPPLDHDDYLWSLEDGEGVSDFFDTYDLGDLLQSWGIDEVGGGN